MMKFPFNRGDLVSYEGNDNCFVTFVCPEYITVCTHQSPDKNTLIGYKQVNVVVHRTYWDTITPRISNEKNNPESSV